MMYDMLLLMGPMQWDGLGSAVHSYEFLGDSRKVLVLMMSKIVTGIAILQNMIENH